MKAKFNPKSERAIAGLKFQNTVMNEIMSASDTHQVEDTREYFKRKNPELSEKEITILEKTWGDITFMSAGKRYWIECCFAMGDTQTSMCEIKRKNFAGENKWYCWGKRVEPDVRIFIPSLVWKKYLGRVKLINRNGWKYRTMPIRYIGENIRAAKVGLHSFINCV